MDTQTKLPGVFKEFFRLLKTHSVDYLLVGGYAVTYHGYPRPTGDLDIWISRDQENVAKLLQVLREYGFNESELSAGIFEKEKSLVVFGVEPFKIEIMNFVSGLEFEASFAASEIVSIDSVEIQMIGLSDLRKNKRAAGRHKDLADLENLPEVE